jgi:PAS domain S-box-containing protein
VAEAPGVDDPTFRTGDALFVFDDELRIRSWNRSAEELTGVTVEEAVGRPCWDVLGGSEENGTLVCHPGCAYARLAREGWPVRSHDVVVRTRTGRRRVAMSTIALSDARRNLFLHLLRDARDHVPENETADPPDLTPRELQVLELMADGLAAKAIAAQLGITVATVRNHIHAILLELGCHSQLGAVAQARRRGLLR